jgi:HAD superfamily hydrolase (TIGR01509 family)
MTESEHSTRFNGLSTKRKLEMLTVEGRLPNDKALHNLIEAQKQILTVQYIEEFFRPITRVIDTVRFAASIGQVALVTNCSRYTTQLMLEKSNLAQFFKIVVTNEDVGGSIKPSPYPYIAAVEQISPDLCPSECMAIEDSPKGIAAAHAAGCFVWELPNFEALTVSNLMDQIKLMREVAAAWYE